jgi:hypothetical protein
MTPIHPVLNLKTPPNPTLQVYNCATADPIVLLRRPDPALPAGCRPYLTSHTKCLYSLTPAGMQQLPGVSPAMCSSRPCWTKAQMGERTRVEQSAWELQQQMLQQQMQPQGKVP